MAEITFTLRRGVSMPVLFDDEDAPWIIGLKSRQLMGVGTKKYALCTVQLEEGARRFLVHRLIGGLDQHDRREIDHISGETLDNRRVNLRIVSRQFQQQNLRPQRARKGKLPASRHRGVTWVPSRQRWFANAQVCGNRVFVGSYREEKDAAFAAREMREHLLSKAVKDGLLDAPTPVPSLEENIYLKRFLAEHPPGHWSLHRTHCKHGHEFTTENTQYDSGGFKRCRLCARDRERRYRERQRVTAVKR